MFNISYGIVHSVKVIENKYLAVYYKILQDPIGSNKLVLLNIEDGTEFKDLNKTSLNSLLVLPNGYLASGSSGGLTIWKWKKNFF